MDEIQKIELDPVTVRSSKKPETAPMATNRKAQSKRLRFSKKLFAKVGVGVLVVLLLAFFFVILPTQRIFAQAVKTKAQVQIALTAIKHQDVANGAIELKKTKDALVATQKDLGGLWYLRFIPFVNNYYNDADHGMKAAGYGIDAAIVTVDSVTPYADLLGLKGQGSFSQGSAEQRIQTAVLTMGKITPRIDDVVKNLNLAKGELDKIDPNHYPSFLVGKKVHDQIVTAKKMADEGVAFIDEARPLIKQLPILLGEDHEKRYFVIFQNDKELRPTGGFMTAYAIFRIDKGIIHVERSDDIYNLDASVRNRPAAPAPIVKYLPKVSTFNLRDSNLSPDFVESMKTFNKFYDNAAGKVDVDGIIALDTHVLVSTIKILDDEVQAGGVTFTSKEDKRCDCPEVIYVLEDNISRPVGYLKGGGRKDLLGSLLFAIMEKALKSSPKIYWGPLFQDFIAQTNEKHVLFSLYNTDAQKGIESLNAAGRIRSFDGDYLHINQANFGGAKSNLFVQETVNQDIKIDKDGSIVKTITIDYKNPHAPSDCNLEHGDLCLNATLRDWIRVYVPKGSQLVDSKGSEVKLTTYDELGKTVFEGFLTVEPLGAKEYILTYRLPFKLASSSILPFLIQKQPGTSGNAYTIHMNGKKVQEFSLMTDMTLQLKQ